MALLYKEGKAATMMHPNRRILGNQKGLTWIKFATYAVVGIVCCSTLFPVREFTTATISSLTTTTVRQENDGRNSFVRSADPFLNPLNGHELTESSRKKEIPQLTDHTDELPYHKSYLRVTNTTIPFYLSTNDAKVDYMRVGIFDTGNYYEFRQSEGMQDILKYENERMSSADKQHKRPIMIDVGGNVGWFSMLSAAHGAEVYVFEPNVVNMVRLCESAVLNGWSSSSNPVYNQLHPFMKGVSNNHGEALKMHKPDPRNPGSFTFAEKGANEEEVAGGLLELVTLDALARSQNWLDEDDNSRIAILKIDVEGLELKVYAGAKELLKSRKVKNIFMEWGVETNELEEWKGVFSSLIDLGYELFKIGTWAGPDNIVEDKFENGNELVGFLSTSGAGNIWLRLVEE